MTAKKKRNPVWGLFSSVKLALVLLCILAATSVIGTIIQQNKPHAQYVKEYGANMAHWMEVLHFTDMYNSWWFLSLLCLFCVNLIVCSLERIPNVIRIVTKDNLALDPGRLAKMRIHAVRPFAGDVEDGARAAARFLQDKGWKPERRQTEGGILLFAQKGPWTRFGVYIVHVSILIILFGALIGSSLVARNVLKNPKFAFKGSVMVPESKSTDFIYSFIDGSKIDLDFAVRCDFFTIKYYPNGMPKTYLSRVTVIDNDKEVLTTDLKVNKPLTYKGITFYQSSYQAYHDFVVSIVNQKTGVRKTAIVTPAEQIDWKEVGASFGLLSQEVLGEEVKRIKIWFTDNQGEPVIFWVHNGQPANIQRRNTTFTLTAKQLYATGLQVTKDPGVWFVYIGCAMMLLGLFVAFFLSHRKIYAFIHRDKGKTQILFAGSAHKNKVGFAKKFEQLIESFPST